MPTIVHDGWWKWRNRSTEYYHSKTGWTEVDSTVPEFLVIPLAAKPEVNSGQPRTLPVIQFLQTRTNQNYCSCGETGTLSTQSRFVGPPVMAAEGCIVHTQTWKGWRGEGGVSQTFPKFHHSCVVLCVQLLWLLYMTKAFNTFFVSLINSIYTLFFPIIFYFSLNVG